MAFDLHIHIDSESLEANVVESIVRRDHVSPEEAVLRVLREKGALSPAQEMIGAFSSPEDLAIMDEAMQHVRELRASDQLRDFGL